jgi:hypothetical protein
MESEHAKKLTELRNGATLKYFAWVRHMMLMATGELTALIALQGQFVPARPQLLWSLSVTWISLATALVLASVVLYGEYDVEERMLRETQIAVNQIQAGSSSQFVSPKRPWWQKMARTMFPLSLAASLVFLCTFALANLGNK